MKFTVIYTKHFMCGSHWNTLVSMKRIKIKSMDNYNNALDKHEIDPGSVVFIFEGWPKLEGEVN